MTSDNVIEFKPAADKGQTVEPSGETAGSVVGLVVCLMDALHKYNEDHPDLTVQTVRAALRQIEIQIGQDGK